MSYLSLSFNRTPLNRTSSPPIGYKQYFLLTSSPHLSRSAPNYAPALAARASEPRILGAPACTASYLASLPLHTIANPEILLTSDWSDFSTKNSSQSNVLKFGLKPYSQYQAMKLSLGSKCVRNEKWCSISHLFTQVFSPSQTIRMRMF